LATAATTATILRQAQATRFATLDALLPPTAPNPDGELITAALPDGQLAGGVLVHTENGPGTLASLWSARHLWELFPLVGQHGPAGMDALLRAWRLLLDRSIEATDPDTACLVTWPSRDVEVSRVLLDHGFVPLSVLAVRTEPVSPVPPFPAGTVVRRARPGDLDVAVQLALAELSYSALVGTTMRRPDAATLKRESLGYRITHGDPVWLAERDGVPIGLAECWLTDADPATMRRFPVPPGRWGYVNTVSVLPGARGAGIGRALVSVAHRELGLAGAVGSYLYYNPPNPLSSVFWPRQGYRPLWTLWEIRPAGALR
jgi:GNAT superfamily N-acetyltransferase